MLITTRSTASPTLTHNSEAMNEFYIDYTSLLVLVEDYYCGTCKLSSSKLFFTEFHVTTPDILHYYM